MKILRYRGKIEDFNQKWADFERNLVEKTDISSPLIEGSLIEGRCSAEGTARFKQRAST